METKSGRLPWKMTHYGSLQDADGNELAFNFPVYAFEALNKELNRLSEVNNER